MSLLAELKRRKVFKVGAAYLIVAWLAIQVLSIAFPAFDAPPWLLRVCILFALLGFPITLVMTWVFDATPEGVKLDADVAGSKRIFAAAAVLALLALGWYFKGQPSFRKDEVARPAAAAATKPAAVPAKAAEAKPELGVAVLPFTNFSPDPDNAFFAAGVFDEVLTRVSRISGLKVISRTSMERIASEKLEVPQIGRRLGVSHVLEGSVQRDKDKVRITVQLIEAATDRHVWAENYDRKLDDVFAIQSEISLAIAEQLKIALSPKQQASLAERPTKNAEAYDLYLRALNERRTWRGAAGFRDMIALLEPAVRLDPTFRNARVMLAEAYGRVAWLGEDPDGSFERKTASELAAIEKAWPGSDEARQARANYFYTIERDYAAALALLQPLALERPNDMQIASGIAGCLKRLGRAPEHLAAAQRWVALDPESPLALGELAQAYTRTGQ
ncbi:MAG: hypothetical protein ABI588_09820, partial [Arenimonas sp.]